MDNEYKDFVVFVTGAAHGQGRAVALAFARRGARVAGFDLEKGLAYPAYELGSAQKLSALKEELEQAGGQAMVFAGDVRDDNAVSAAVAVTIESWGRIDLLFNNAGISAYGLAHELKEDEWDAMIDINLKGPWLVARRIIPHLIRQRSGVIINNSSVAGLRGFKRLSHYCASKWGLVGLTKSWALELAPHNVRVVSIHPTGVNTPMNDGLAALEGTTPTEIAQRSAGNLLDVPWIETEDVVEAVLYLASAKARFITGSQLVIDAGLLTV